MSKNIFIDTFALNQLTKEKNDQLILFLKKSNHILLLSSFQLIELFNPNPQLDNRSKRIANLYSEVPFIIVDQEMIFNCEEAFYPNMVSEIPVVITSDKIFMKLQKRKDKFSLLIKLFSEGLPEFNVNIKEWVKQYTEIKSFWANDVERIIENAKLNRNLKKKDDFCQSLDLRLCPNIYETKVKMDSGIPIEKMNRIILSKIAQILEKHDTWKMKGIHLSSLIIWYDYILAKKKINLSDLGDLYHSIFFPYCNKVLVDNSRYDCCIKIQKNEDHYQNVNFYNKREFLKFLIL